MKKTNKAFVCIIVVLLSVFVLSSCATSGKFKATDSTLSLWTDEAPAKQELIAYLEAITDPANPDFIPVERRIAVFDFDGTLFCETDPDYIDHMLLAYRVLEDPEYKDKASSFERYVANEIITKSKTSSPVGGLDIDHGKAVASAFKGMTLDEFYAYVQAFKKTAMPSYEGMNRGDGFYLPMLEIVNLLEQYGFTNYIVTGTDRFIIRGLFIDSPLSFISPSHIIGSDESLVATGQGKTDPMEYYFLNTDKVVLGGEFLLKDLKMNKVILILREIGVQPVLSFGNSTGDASMAEYVITNNQYRSLAFMLCCDDTVRENGNLSKAQSMVDLCTEHGWIPVSMKNDWTTIYGDGVTKK
jgi:phosphoglycolate phosphatase-like HAD superfamily hydrolase